MWPVRRAAPAWIVLLCACGIAAGQPPTRLFVEPFANRGGAALREAVVKLLGERKDIVLAGTAADSDRVLDGQGETYVKGYLSLNPRVRYVNSDSRPVYKGFLSVELKDRNEDPLWSYLATPRRYGPEDVNRNLAAQVVERLLQFLTKPGSASHH
jgi:hypothetical protein